MRIFVTIQHPAHVHFFKNAIEKFQSDGHTVDVFARDKDIALYLLDAYDIEYKVLAGQANSASRLAFVQMKYELRQFYESLKTWPDVGIDIGCPGIHHVTSLVGAKSIFFTDTEHATLQNKLAFPFADRICTPDCYLDELGEKQYKYPSYHELAYLHPDRFNPDPSVLRKLEVEVDDTLVLLRTVAWQAAHDVGKKGVQNVTELVRELESTGATVRISSESNLPTELKDRQYNINPEEIHHVLHYANLFVGEGATMAAESAVLGTPAIHITPYEMGYTEELEHRYQLMFNFTGENRFQNGLQKTREIIHNNSIEWHERRQKMLSEKADTTDVIINQTYSVSRS